MSYSDKLTLGNKSKLGEKLLAKNAPKSIANAVVLVFLLLTFNKFHTLF